MNKLEHKLDDLSNLDSFFGEISRRGLIKQMTDENLLKQSKMVVYCGFDPSSDSLHIGSLLPLATLRRFQLAGHKVICLVGGATGMIGDPSFKSQERAFLSAEQVRHNTEGIKKVFARFLDTSPNSQNPAIVVNNVNWFEGISYIDFLRDVGKHFTINHMMAKESVRSRLEDRENGISYTEFSYMLLQAYDFWYLNKTYGCNLQIGGSDQWGNITAGTELIRRLSFIAQTGKEDIESQNKSESSNKNDDVFGLTMPLVLKSDGTKFGKTESGTIWLDPDKTSPYQLYQFLLQTSDDEVLTYIQYFSFLSDAETQKLENSLKTEPEKRLAQKALAEEVTKLVHGQEELAKAQSASSALFGDLKTLDEKNLLQMLEGAPRLKKKRGEQNVGFLDLIVESGLTNSKGQGRKDIAGGGFYLNNEKIVDPGLVISEKDLLASKYVLLRKGKKNYVLVVWEN